MNSLEFIEKEIKITQKSYSAFELDYMLLGRESDKKEYERLLKKLKHLQQIKSELEAWYVVKEDIEYQSIKYCDERPEYTYEYKEWSFKLTEDYPNFEEKSEKLKKAVEVEE